MAKGKYTELVKRAEDGTITSAELDMVAKELQDVSDVRDIPMLLIVLGAAHEKGMPYLAIVESFLDNSDDLIANTALEVLARYWHLAANYRDLILKLMMGIPSDEHRARKVQAIGVTGMYLHSHTDPEVLRALLTLFEMPETDALTRWFAYEELVKAMHGDWIKLLHTSVREPDKTKLMNPSIIERAKKRLAKEEAKQKS